MLEILFYMPYLLFLLPFFDIFAQLFSMYNHQRTVFILNDDDIIFRKNDEKILIMGCKWKKEVDIYHFNILYFLYVIENEANVDCDFVKRFNSSRSKKKYLTMINNDLEKAQPDLCFIEYLESLDDKKEEIKSLLKIYENYHKDNLQNNHEHKEASKDDAVRSVDDLQTSAKRYIFSLFIDVLCASRFLDLKLAFSEEHLFVFTANTSYIPFRIFNLYKRSSVYVKSFHELVNEVQTRIFVMPYSNDMKVNHFGLLLKNGQFDNKIIHIWDGNLYVLCQVDNKQSDNVVNKNENNKLDTKNQLKDEHYESNTNKLTVIYQLRHISIAKKCTILRKDGNKIYSGIYNGKISIKIINPKLLENSTNDDDAGITYLKKIGVLT